MKPAALALAEFAAALRYEDIPPSALERMRQCVADTLAVSLLGSTLPWGRMAAAHAREHGQGGRARLIGTDDRVHAPVAALANGVFAHGFELDNLRQPGAGVHAGAALVPSALALVDTRGASGRELLTALVAATEVMFRIGAATKHSSETLGFHAPGLTGPFGAAICAGRLMGLDAVRLADALGIAGSLCGGLLAFSQANRGSMVKRLHLGRAAEAGVVAASLTSQGYEGPETVFEGHHGFLDTYCEQTDPLLLTDGLGERWETERICIKRYACHVTAHTPVQSILQLRREYGFDGGDVERIAVRASAKVLSHHARTDPSDVMSAQYSVPFCAALALFDDPLDPKAFSERGLASPAVRDMAKRIVMELLPQAPDVSPWASEVSIALRDGRSLGRFADQFNGTPAHPLSTDELREKCLRCAEGFPNAAELFDQVMDLDRIRDVRTLRLD